MFLLSVNNHDYVSRIVTDVIGLIEIYSILARFSALRKKQSNQVNKNCIICNETIV